MTEALLLDLDRVLNPDDPTLDFRTGQLHEKIADSVKPLSFLPGPANVIDTIRKAHRQRKVSLIREKMPVDDHTPAYTFWEYYTTIEEMYQAVNDDKSN